MRKVGQRLKPHQKTSIQNSCLIFAQNLSLDSRTIAVGSGSGPSIGNGPSPDALSSLSAQFVDHHQVRNFQFPKCSMGQQKRASGKFGKWGKWANGPQQQHQLNHNNCHGYFPDISANLFRLLNRYYNYHNNNNDVNNNNYLYWPSILSSLSSYLLLPPLHSLLFTFSEAFYYLPVQQFVTPIAFGQVGKIRCTMFVNSHRILTCTDSITNEGS